MVHVPYKGGSEAINATIAGEVNMSIVSIAPALPLLESGRVKPIAVTSLKRASIMPSIPTMDESGLIGYDRSSWYGILTPKDVQKTVIAKLNTIIGKSLNTAETKNEFRKHSLDVQTNSPEQFATFISNEIAQNIKVVKLIGLKPE